MISSPMLRAVPAMMRIAASIVVALRSAILVSAIWRICSAVTVPIFSRFGVPDPLTMPAACFSKAEAGGDFVMNEKERSEYTVTTTGVIMLACPWVCALKALQNSMILTPCCPRDGPTGGEGVACPAGTCNFTFATTCFAMFHSPRLRLRRLLNQLDL